MGIPRGGEEKLNKIKFSTIVALKFYGPARQINQKSNSNIIKLIREIAYN